MIGVSVIKVMMREFKRGCLVTLYTAGDRRRSSILFEPGLIAMFLSLPIAYHCMLYYETCEFLLSYLYYSIMQYFL